MGAGSGVYCFINFTFNNSGSAFTFNDLLMTVQ
jgi:hypothetical protein